MSANKARFEAVPQLTEFSPADLAARAQSRVGMVFFDSARDQEPSADRHDGRQTAAPLSILALEPELWLTGNVFEEADFARLQHVVAELTAEYEGSAPFDDGLPGAIVAGAIEYDGAYRFGLYRKVLVYRHREKLWYACADETQASEGGLSWWHFLLEEEPASERHSEPNGCELKFRATVEKETFCDSVRRAQEYIRAGDIYQVNLSHRLEAEWNQGNPWELYEALRHYSPAPYAAFVRQPGRCILSSSPELFLKFSGRGVRTRPIKGTRPRRSEVHADERNAFELLTSPKEVSELIMITDLERSDLGQFCEWGSVEVSELLKLERHEQVFHLVSTVEGRLREGVDALSALRGCFPGGSITGAPKKRAREIIAELEGRSRGLYTGALGWFGASGESAFNILIRTVVVEENGEGKPALAHFDVGAGVVADSVPEQEWQETWDKAAGILLAAERMQPKRSDSAGSCVARTSLV
jgi:anthranilate/para-aminobenzoate synthase component I